MVQGDLLGRPGPLSELIERAPGRSANGAAVGDRLIP